MGRRGGVGRPAGVGGSLPVSEDVSRELEFHLAMRVEELVAEGWTPEAARREAERLFGDVRRIAAECRIEVEAKQSRGRRQRWRGWLEGLGRDVRFGVRSLRRAPGFAAVAVLTLVLGTGANAAVFSIVNAVLLRPLPYPDADRLYFVAGGGLTPDNFPDWRGEARGFDGFAAFNLGNAALSGGMTPEATLPANVGVMPVSEDFFQVVGVHPVLGRVILPEEYRPDAPPVAVVSQKLWRARFGASARPAGQTITLNGRSFTVVGVMPPGFDLGAYQNYDVWTPLAQYPQPRGIGTLVRLSAGTTPEQAQAELERLATLYPTRAPAIPGLRRRAFLQSMVNVERGEVREPLLILLGAALLVLLIACGNVANLLLARGAARGRELAVRSALGAGRGRVVRQLLAESAVIAFLGAVGGLLLAGWSTRAFLSLAPSFYISRTVHASIDPMVLAFTLAIASLTTILVGVGPALSLGRRSPARVLAEAAWGSSESRRSRRLRDGLVGSQVALAMLLLVGTGLLLRTFLALLPRSPGFAVRDRYAATITLPPDRYPDSDRRRAYVRRLVEQVEAVPGHPPAAIVSMLPLAGMLARLRVDRVDDQRLPAVDDHPTTVDFYSATPGYLRVIDRPVLRGRALQPTDAAGARKVAVISQATARLLWPDGQDPLGHRLALDLRNLGQGSADSVPDLTVVGIIPDAHTLGMRSTKPRAEVYVSYWQVPTTLIGLVVHRTPGTRVDAGVLRRAAAAVDDQVALGDITTLQQLGMEWAGPTRFQIALLGTFAALALLLAAVGCFGMLSYSVVQQSRELGIRMALGAPRTEVARLVLQRGMRVVVLGITAGLLLSWAVTRVLENSLFGVQPTDPATYAGVALLLVGVTLLAAYLPARRAARVDPMVAIRVE